MISATRMLCQKYTDLTDAEISYLESYGPAPRPGQRRAGGCLHRLPDRQRALCHRGL